jgi:hypothetical protein
VHDAAAVRLGEPGGRPVQDGQRLGLRKWALALHPFAHRLATHELHHQPVQAVLLAHVHDPDDVLMGEARTQPRFAFEAGDELRRVGGQRRLQALHRDVEVELAVPTAVDGAHAALADLGVEHGRVEHLEALDHGRGAQQRVVQQIGGGGVRLGVAHGQRRSLGATAPDVAATMAQSTARSSWRRPPLHSLRRWDW